MKISNSVKPLIKELVQIKYLNMNVADMLLNIYQNEIHPEKEDSLNKEILFNFLMDYLEMDLSNKENYLLCKEYFLDNIHECELAKYAGNPYVNAFKGINFKEKGYELKTLSYAPYQLFPLSDIMIDVSHKFKEFTPTGFLKEEYKYLAILKNNKIWMSLNPNEINTMEPHLELANGDILVLGLGLGYFPYMASLKENVKSITIVENDKNIIDIFNSHLISNFKHKDKITIIQYDAVEYLKKHHDFTYIFADLWHDPTDGIDLFIKLKKLETEYSLNISYWLNQSMYAMLRRIALTVLEEALLNYDDSKYLKSKDPIDTIINTMYFKSKKIAISNENELNSFLSDSNLISILIN